MHYLTQVSGVLAFQCTLHAKIIYIPFSCIKSFKGTFYACVAQSCPTLFDPMDCGTPGSLSFTLSQSCSNSRPTMSFSAAPSPPALSLPHHQGLFQCVDSSHKVGQSIGASASASVRSMPQFRTLAFQVLSRSSGNRLPCRRFLFRFYPKVYNRKDSCFACCSFFNSTFSLPSYFGKLTKF